MGEVMDWMQGYKQTVLDVGAKDGSFIKDIFDPLSMDESKIHDSLKILLGGPLKRKMPFNASKPIALCVLAFEANPRWHNDLDMMAKGYVEQGIKVKVVKVSPTDHNGIDAIWQTGITKMDTQTQVHAFDLKSFINNKIQPLREAPGTLRKLVVKFDLDGQEYNLMPQLMKDTTLCQKVGIDSVFMRFKKAPPDAP